jgi:hypothetical protein
MRKHLADREVHEREDQEPCDQQQPDGEAEEPARADEIPHDVTLTGSAALPHAHV